MGLVTVALVVALGVWVFGGNGTGSPAAAVVRPTTPAQSAAASASASAAAQASASTAAAAAASAAASAAAARQAAATAALPSEIDAILGGGGDTWSVATVNLATGAAMTLGSSSGMYTGSIIKVTVLENLLRREGGVANLSSSQRSLATAMITQSDNAAALSLYNQGGAQSALVQTCAMLGLTDTQIAGGGYFGVSTTSAADQIKVLHQLIAPTFLTAADVAYIRGLMGDVETDQRWGTPTAADPGTPTENKNGWLNNDSDHELWLVNSLGIITIGGQPYLMAALTQHNPDFETGVARLNQVVQTVAAALRP